MKGGEKSSANIDHLLIDIDHDHPFYRSMVQHLPEGSPLATASDEHPLGMGVGDHRGVNQGLVVDKLIGLAGLNLAIQDQTSTEAAAFDDLDGLKFCLPRID